MGQIAACNRVLYPWNFPIRSYDPMSVIIFILLFRIIIIGMTIGIIDEIYQGIIPGRFTSSTDVIADGIGVISGAFISKYSLRSHHG